MRMEAVRRLQAGRMNMDKERFVVDRFEGDFAVAECCGEMVNIPRSEIPEGASEGSVLKLAADGGYILDPEALKKLPRIKRAFEALFQ